MQKVVNTKVSVEVYEKLRKIASEKGKSVAELLREIIHNYLGVSEGSSESGIDEIRKKVAELEERLSKLEVYLGKLQSSIPSSIPQVNLGNTHESTRRRRGKTRAIDILRDEKVMYEADIAGRIRDRDAFFGRLRKDGAVVVETAKQRIAVDPDFWDEFKKKLEKADTTNDEVLKEQLGEDGLKLLRVLREEGAVYFDGVERKWKFIIEPESE